MICKHILLGKVTQTLRDDEFTGELQDCTSALPKENNRCDWRHVITCVHRFGPINVPATPNPTVHHRRNRIPTAFAVTIKTVPD
jgi:hypothetical protein